MAEYSIGQIWKNRRRKPESAFTILKIHTRQYPDGNSVLRVKGLLVCGLQGATTHLRDLDARSLEKMFPYLMFSPPEPVEDEDK